MQNTHFRRAARFELMELGVVRLDEQTARFTNQKAHGTEMTASLMGISTTLALRQNGDVYVGLLQAAEVEDLQVECDCV